MNYLLGIVAIICCFILSTFNVFPDNPINNAALWGVVVSVIYMLLSARTRKNAN